MSKITASSDKKVKRRWSFSRGKVSNGKIIVSALAVTGAVFAAAFTIFEYRHDAPPGNIQKSALYHIDSRSMPEFFRQLELRDPGNVFRNSFALLPARETPGNSLYTDDLPEISNVQELKNTPFEKLKEYEFPLTINFFNLQLPQEFFPPAVSKVMDSNGREVFSIALPAAANDNKHRKSTVIQLSSFGKNIRQMRIINSCGSAELDKFAVEKISSRDLPGGTYVVLWGEADKSVSGGEK